jgi:hypothetical protein
MRYFTTAPSPFQNRRSVLSPQSPWPTEEPAAPAPVAPRYTCAQRLALGFWASAKLREASAKEQLETLRHYPGLEVVWGRTVQRALDSNCQQAMTAEAAALWARCERLHAQRLRLRQQLPNLFTAIAA